MRSDRATVPQMKDVWPAISALRNPDHTSEFLRNWSRRLASQALSAVQFADSFRSVLSRRDTRVAAVSNFYGLHARHVFYSYPVTWLRPTEVQITKALAQFLQDGGSQRILAFLRALDPGVRWPSHLKSALVQAEELTSSKSRIDLLVSGSANGVRWGCAIEAKFGSGLQNPLSDYVKHVESLALTECEENRVFVFAIVGQRQRMRIKVGPPWQILTWRTLLRRFEGELAGLPDDDTFSQYRRTIWERA